MEGLSNSRGGRQSDGEKIRGLLEEKGLSIRGLAGRHDVPVTRRTIQKAVNSQNVSQFTLETLANVLLDDSARWRELVAQTADVLVVTIELECVDSEQSEEVLCEALLENFSVFESIISRIKITAKGKSIHLLSVENGSIKIRLLVPRECSKQVVADFKKGAYTDLLVSDIHIETTQTENVLTRRRLVWAGLLLLLTLFAGFLVPLLKENQIERENIFIIPAGRINTFPPDDTGRRASRMALRVENRSGSSISLPNLVFCYVDGVDKPCAGYTLSTGQNPIVQAGDVAVINFVANDLPKETKNIEFTLERKFRKLYSRGYMKIPVSNSDSGQEAFVEEIELWAVGFDTKE